MNTSGVPGVGGPSRVRALGVDLGSKRIGIALLQLGVATPLETLQRARSVAEDHRKIASLVTEWEPDVVVVGLPLDLRGSAAVAARSVISEVLRLQVLLSAPVTVYDERLTTVVANRSLRDLGMRRTEKRTVIDQLAAAVIVQSWLDAGAPMVDVATLLEGLDTSGG